MITEIIIKGSHPDDTGLYCWSESVLNRYYLGPYYNENLICVIESDFKTNTIRILELKNVLEQYDKLTNRKLLITILKKQQICLKRK